MPKRNRRTSNRSYKRRVSGRREEFANILSDPRGRLASQTTATSDRSQIANYLKNPAGNAVQIASAMRDAYMTNGTISTLIDYFQSHPTYNYTVFPIMGNKQYDIQEQARQDYIDVAYALDTYNVKYWSAYFLKETLIEGVTFWYKVEDSDGIEYLKIPIDWCLIRSQENGVYRFMVDVSRFQSEILTSLPEELQTAYEQYSKGDTSDENQWYNGKYYFVSEKGVAFTFDHNALTNGGLAVSPFAGALLDITSVKQAKDNVDIKDKLDTTRILQQRIPMDDNDGRILMSAKEAKIYDEMIRNRLPEGVVLATTPTKLENIPLTNSGNSNAYETVNKGIQQMFYGLGTPAPLFGGDTSSANIVKESIKKDANWIYTNVFPLFENYYNSEIEQVKTKSKLKWKFEFIHQSNFTLKDDISNYKDQLSYGGSRIDYLAANHFSPAEVLSKLQFEQQALKIDDVMAVKPTSNTISSKEVVDQKHIGRPKKDNISDDTDRLDNEQE